MKIQPIVEGHGDVSAVPVLLRRLLHEGNIFTIDIGRPIRRNRHDFVKQDALERVTRLGAIQSDCCGVLILFDADDDCPKEMIPHLRSWAEAATDKPVRITMVKKEYEAWFLASINSLRGHRGIQQDALPVENPEEIRGAKERLQEFMKNGWSYSETVDQAAFSQLVDLRQLFSSSRSFRHLVSSLKSILQEVGILTNSWVFDSW